MGVWTTGQCFVKTMSAHSKSKNTQCAFMHALLLSAFLALVNLAAPKQNKPQADAARIKSPVHFPDITFSPHKLKNVFVHFNSSGD